MKTEDYQFTLLDLAVGLIICVVVVGIALCLPQGEENRSDDEDRDSDVHIYDNF